MTEKLSDDINIVQQALDDWTATHAGISDRLAALKKLDSETAEFVEMPRWIPVGERLPAKGQKIWGLNAGMGGAWQEEFDPDEPIGNMTHWCGLEHLPEITAEKIERGESDGRS